MSERVEVRMCGKVVTVRIIIEKQECNNRIRSRVQKLRCIYVLRLEIRLILFSVYVGKTGFCRKFLNF